MIRLPANFDTRKFAQFYGLSTEIFSGDFYVYGNGFLCCPSLPDLTEDDLAQFTYIPQEPPATTEQEIEALKLVIGMLMEGDDDV